MMKEFLKKKENVIYIIILAVVLLISVGQIFSDDSIKKESEKNIKQETAFLEEKEEQRKDLLEQKLAKIISNIQGIEEADVLVTYKGSEKIVPAYETKEENKIEENVTQNVKEKNIAYEEDEKGRKKVIVESSLEKEVEGVIVCAKGNIDAGLKSEIIKAVATVTNVATNKVKIFNK